MNNESLVSVITPMYNAEKYILETIQSVMQQTYQNWEMIIVDNKSTDNSIEIVKSIEDERIKIIKLEYNSGGPARPRNIGIENSKGEYIAFLDADDVWLPLKLEKQIKILEENHDIDIVHTLANVIDDKSKYVSFFNNQNLYNIFKFIISKKNILFYTNNININSTIMKKNIEIKFDEDENLVTLEDWKYWIDCKNDHKLSIFLLNEVLLNYRIHNNAISNRGTDKGYRRALYMISILLLANKIPLRHYFLSSLMNLFKISIYSSRDNK